MAAPNEVRVNIRHNVLLLKTFTVPQLQAITGLNRQSIHTEIRRMERERLVSRVGVEQGKEGSAGGRPPVVYQLTSDPEKRFEVLQSVRAFYVGRERPASEFPRPESKHYFIARDLLQDSIAKRTFLAPNEKAERLALIKKRLEYARREEEVGEKNTQLIAASFDILEAQALDTLEGDWEKAVRPLDEARRVCQQFGANDLVAEILAYVQNMVNHMAAQQRSSYDAGEYEVVEQIAKDLDIMKHRFGDAPGISNCIEQAEWVAEKAHDLRIRAEVSERMKGQIELIATALSRMQAALIEGMLTTAVEPSYVDEFRSWRWRPPVRTPPPPSFDEPGQLQQYAGVRSRAIYAAGGPADRIQ
jgi:hypothetical protein